MDASNIIRIKTNIEQIRSLNGGGANGVLPIGQHLDNIKQATYALEKEMVEGARATATLSLETQEKAEPTLGDAMENNLPLVMYSLLSMAQPHISTDNEEGRDLRSRIDCLMWLLGEPGKGAA